MKHTLITLLLLIASTVAFGAATAYTVETVPNVQLENSHAFVSNPDGILSARTVATLDSMLYRLRQENTSEFVVVALTSIGDADPRTFANELFAHWGIGRKEKDNGLLLLFVEDQRRVTVEVGYGLEGILPDATCYRLISDYMIPYFKEASNDSTALASGSLQAAYNKGMTMGVRAFVTYMTTDEANRELMAPTEKEEGINWGKVLMWYVIVSLVVLAFFVWLIRAELTDSSKTTPDARYRALAPLSSVLLLPVLFFPATMLPLYIWLKRKMQSLRKGPFYCDSCRQKLSLLPDSAKPTYLTPIQQTEQRIGATDHDIWKCERCGRVKVLAYERPSSTYTECQSCHARAVAMDSDRVLLKPTTLREGRGEKVFSCRHCGATHSEYYTIPVLPPPVIIGGGGGGNHGGGGGFSGGSFGGGRSGGGGASVGW